jgi:hypothetical protein
MRTSAPTEEIPKAQWKTYFPALAEAHQGWATTVEVLGHDIGEQRRIGGLPMQGISYDPEGSQAGDILIEAGDAGTPFDTHLVHKPTAARIAAMPPGGSVEVDLEIDSEDGYMTLVHLRPRQPLPPPGGTT